MTRSLFVAAFCWSFFAAAVSASEPFKVIVNADNPVTEVSKATVRNYFLGRATRWPHGPAVRPIDLGESSPVREAFSEEVLGRPPRAVKSYWLTQVFAGRGTPPVQLRSEDEVLTAVRDSPEAIAYLSASTALGPGVKALSVTD